MPCEVVKIPPINKSYKPTPTQFGIVNGNFIDWEKCRETFQNKSANLNEFLFCCAEGCGERVIKFMKEIEATIRVPADSALKISFTTAPDVLHVLMSDWWKYRVRRSLLTALLRCGQQYTGSFRDALYSQPYTKSTKPAVERFMKGHTAIRLKKKDSFDGWVNYFGSSEGVATKTLVKLKRKKK